MSAGKKIALAISPLVILSITLIVFNYLSMKKIQAQILNISEFAVIATELVQTAKIMFGRQSKFYEDVVFLDDLDAIESAREASGEIAEILGRLGNMSGQIRTESDIFLHKLDDYTNSASVVYIKMSEDNEFLEKTENIQIVKKLGKEKNRLTEELDGFSELVRNEISRKISSANMSAKTRNDLTAAISSAIIGFSVLIILFIIKRKIVSPVVRTIEESDRGIGQIFLSSEQIASLSQMLAQGTSEHAAASEMKSSALEEVSSMVRKNADNTGQADNFMKKAGQVIKKANDSMMILTYSMEEIILVGQETSKVVKMIDEIAFQTNLLALNASVEAARAGETGAGFAVVAGEVKNLAMRTAEATRNTSDLIEKTLEKIQIGGDIVSETRNIFAKVANFSDKIEKLIISIAGTSEEQAVRIEQISKAFTEIDKVAQDNAAIAEKSASASEKMRAQGEMIKNLINELRSLVSTKATSGKIS